MVWKYGEDIQYKQDGKKFWYCYLCEKQQELPSIGNGNCTSLDHLESKHNIDRNTGEVKAQARSREEGQLSITEASCTKTLVFARRLDIFQIENGYFRELLFYLFPPLANLLPKARATLRRWIMEAFETGKELLKQNMRDAHSNISISFDLWSSLPFNSRNRRSLH